MVWVRFLPKNCVYHNFFFSFSVALDVNQFWNSDALKFIHTHVDNIVMICSHALTILFDFSRSVTCTTFERIGHTHFEPPLPDH